MSPSRAGLQKGNYDLLREFGEKLITCGPSSPIGYEYRATPRLSGGGVTGGEADLLKAIEIAPQDPMAYVRLGGLRPAQKKFAEPEKLFEQALEHNPGFAEALQGVVGLYLERKELDSAIARVNAQIAKSPNTGALYVTLAGLLSNEQQVDQAENALQKALAADKNNLDAFVLLGQILASRGRVEYAARTYEQSLQENPRVYSRLHVLGGLGAKQRRLAEGRGA